VPFALSSRSHLTLRDLPRFPEQTLFHRLARTLCAAGCLPRKELFESWEVARRVRRRFRGGRVVDLACGHGLIAHLMLILDDSSRAALAIDASLPESAAQVSQALVKEWPRLSGRVELIETPLEQVELKEDDVVVSAHACGGLTDLILARATAARARVAVLPCCQAAAKGDQGGLGGWLDPALAIDATRAAYLRSQRYSVLTQTIPDAITPKNRLLLGTPT
jgi:Methyltransferase domain